VRLFDHEFMMVFLFFFKYMFSTVWGNSRCGSVVQAYNSALREVALRQQFRERRDRSYSWRFPSTGVAKNGWFIMEHPSNYR
jgi:hypothetical protein